MATVRIQVRRGTSTDWSTVNPTLAAGEMGVETDTRKIKVGDGSTAWNSLAYIAANVPEIGEIAQDAINSALTMGTGLTKNYDDGGNTITLEIDTDVIATQNYVDAAVAALGGSVDSTYIPMSDRGLAGGVASLDSNTLIPNAQIDSSHWATKTYADGLQAQDLYALQAHAATDTNVHGIADFAQLETMSGAQARVDTLASTVADNLEAHAADYTNVHGVADMTALTTQAYVDGQVSNLNSALGNEIANRESAITEAIGTANAYTDDAVAAEEVARNTAISAEETARNTAVSGVQSNLNTHTSATTSVHGIADTAALATKTYADDAVSAHEADTTNVHGIADTAALATKTYADGKASDAQSAAESTAATALSAHEADTTNIHGIADTSALATKSYADSAVSTHNSDTTGVHGITDTSKLVTTDAQSQTLSGDLTVSGNLTVAGTTTTVDTANFSTTDAMIYLGEDNQANSVDLGFVSSFNDGTYQHSGLVRDASDGKWKLFKGVTDEPTTTVNFSQGSMDSLKVGALEATTVTPSSGIVFTDGTQTKQGVPSQTSISSKTADYTVELSDRDTMIEVNSSSNLTISIPTDATTNFPIGTSIDILRVGTGTVTVSAVTPGTTTLNYTPGNKLRAQWSSASLFKRAANTWVLIGDLTA